MDELDNLNHNNIDNNSRGYHARQGLKFIYKHIDNVEFVLKKDITNLFSEEKNDNYIVSCAKQLNLKLLTLDLGMELSAKEIGVEIYRLTEDKVTNYNGYKEFILTEDDWIARSTKELKYNKWDLDNNEYFLMKNQDNEVQDVIRWTNKGFKEVPYTNFSSSYMDTVKPKDAYQRCAAHSLVNDEITFLCGVAGTAKTLYSLAYLMQMIDKGKINKVYIIHNPIGMAGSKEIGFRSGNTIEKLLQSSIGGILSTKLGGKLAIEMLLKADKLELIPVSDIRGLQIDKGNALYITEAQNMSSYLIKNAIQRCADGSKIIIEGDIDGQVDSEVFKYDSGMKRAIDVFTEVGCESFGVVKLVNNYRGRISAIAEMM